MSFSYYIVTGGCGFVGSHLVEALAARESYVTVIDDMRNGKHVIDTPFVNYRHVAVEDVDIEGYDIPVDGIIHLANTPRVRLSMEEPRDAILNNIVPTVAVCEWARKFKCPLYFAQSSSRLSSSVYSNPYTFGKTIAEENIKLYEKLWQIQSHLMYFYNVYGPREADYGEYSTVIRSFKKQVQAGEPLRIYGSGRKERDFTHVYDVVAGILRLLDYTPSKKPKYALLGRGDPKTILEIAEAFEHPFVHEFDKPGEAEKTYCDKPFINGRHDVINYIKEWKKLNA